MNVIQLENLVFKYAEDTNFSIEIDHFVVEKNSRIFLKGPSGCGKTTFLNLLTGLMKPVSGNINVLGTNLSKLSKTKCDNFRANHFGIIFQLFNLISYLNVADNIMLPCMFSAPRKKKALQTAPTLKQDVYRLCKELDIGNELLEKPVNQLSIGQQQRVAIARALIGQPEIIIADEPTSALDEERKHQFMSILLRECQKYKSTLIFVSHDPLLQSYFDDVYDLSQANRAIKN